MELSRTARLLSALLQISKARGTMVLHVGGQAGRAELNLESTKLARFPAYRGKDTSVFYLYA